MISKRQFSKLPQEHKEKIIAALFQAKYPGFDAEDGVDIDVPAGYTVRVAAVMTAEEHNTIVKKIFAIFEESNSFVTEVDIDTISEYANQLEKAGRFVSTRDDLWFVSNQKWTFQAYQVADGRILLMDLNMILEGIKKYYDDDRELRDTLRHFGLVK